MEIGPNFKNILSYNENMAKGMEDKLFFLNELPKNQEYTFVDFGCADGTLINYLVSIYNNYYTNTYIGYDISDTMIELAKTNFNGGAKDVNFTSDWKDVVKNLSEQPIYRKKVLILSSVIHEVYSYAADQDDIITFWRRVVDSGFDYICIRDMMCSEDLDRPTDPSIIQSMSDIYNDIYNRSNQLIKQKEEFNKHWGSFDNMKNVVHFLLKYRWVVNWERELNENYFPITIDDMMENIIEFGTYNLVYFKRFRVPFLDKCFKDDFNITLDDYTHIKAIFELNKLNKK